MPSNNEEQMYAPISNPLKAMQNMHFPLSDLRELANSLSRVGVGCASEMHDYLDYLEHLVKQASGGIRRETHVRMQENRQSADEIVSAALASFMLSPNSLENDDAQQ